MFVGVCVKCNKNHKDIIEKKISKGCISGYTILKEVDSEMCYLNIFHEDEE